MNVVLAASEAVPFAKTGGLADVAGALPRALQTLGVRCSLVMPGYARALTAARSLEDTGVRIAIPMLGRPIEGFVRKTKLPGSDVDVYLIDQPIFYGREGLYGARGTDYPDNCARFVYFSRAVVEVVRLLDLRPDVIHCNDWQTGLVPVYINEWYRRQVPAFARIGTLMTIHNMAYQGSFWHLDMPLTGLDWSLFNPNRLEAWGRLNFLKAGLVDADLLNTVSPTYAREICTPEFGCGLDGVLRERAADLYGIVNGIDPNVWSPSRDPLIACNYDASSVDRKKSNCKSLLQRRAGLPERPDVPLLAQIGRLDPQKGWDLIAGVADDLLTRDVQLVVLGTGNVEYQDLIGHLAARYPEKVRAFFEFSDPLAHQIEAGADIFLMPSRYEPCGLNQLYSLAYGTVPVVRATGGLADTVVDANEKTLAEGTATGFAFTEASPHALRGAIDRALRLYADPPAWLALVRNGMTQDWSWDRSAGEYLRLYEEIRRRRDRLATAAPSAKRAAS